MIPKEPLKIDEELEQRFRRAATTPMTKEEVRRQRISFVYGNLPQSSTLTREEVEKLLDAREGV